MHIVLDLDETLVSVTLNKPKKYDFKFKLEKEVYYGSTRPHLKKFLKFVFDNYETVSVWTAATKSYAVKILNHIMTKNQRESLAFFLTRKNLKTDNGEITKPLRKIWESSKNTYGLRPSNTVMLDDKDVVTRFNPGNSFIIPAWKGRSDDRYLLKFIQISKILLSKEKTIKFNKYKKHFMIKDI
jgi:TFIIF-interacting CTD phosphatase-like protein